MAFNYHTIGIANATDCREESEKCENPGNYLCRWQYNLGKCGQKYISHVVGTQSNRCKYSSIQIVE